MMCCKLFMINNKIIIYAAEQTIKIKIYIY